MAFQIPGISTFLERLRSCGARAVSFDVFDTLLIRSVAQPTDIFLQVGQTLRRNGVFAGNPERFRRLRVIAEQAARAARQDQEPNLGEIYAQLGTKLGWTADSSEKVLCLELERERASLYPNPAILPWLQAARDANLRIAFVSDMYLPTAFVAEVLQRHGISKAEDPVLVSNHFRVSKHQGGLFDELCKSLRLTPDKILHVGDNLESDVAVPTRRGFHTLHYTGTGLGEIESSYLPFSPDLEGLASVIAGAARRGRIAATTESSHAALVEIGAGLLGPLLVSFTLWTLQRAAARGLDRLYYVSRDGQVMRQVAQAVQQRVPRYGSIDCRYIYGSRIAWHHAALKTLDTRHLYWLLYPQPFINARVFAHRLGASPERVTAIIDHAGLGALARAPQWSEADLAQVQTAVIQAQAELLAEAGIDQRRAVARRYFTQEGLLHEPHRWGLVELGWTGSMITSLHQALNRTEPLHAYYLCQSHDDPYLPASIDLESFLIQPGGASGAFCSGLRAAEMIESLTAADHPTVLGYKETAAGVNPRLKEATRPVWTPPALASLRAGAMAYVNALDSSALEALAETMAEEPTARLAAQMHLAVLAQFVRTPRQDLAEAFLDCNFSEDSADENRRAFARRVTSREALLHGRWPEDDLWPQGTRACASGLIHALLDGGKIKGCTYVLRRLWSYLAS